jgi:hypothetical protein
MNLLDNGLRASENASYGGWGGRRAEGGAAADNGLVNNVFFAAAQRDFAARLQWSVTPTYTGANHEPLVRIDGPLAVSARAGQTVRLGGTVTDPDRDMVTVRWWHYREAGTYPGAIVIRNAAARDATLQLPGDAQPGQTIHVMLEATDSGTPSLTRYQRVILTVRAGPS